MKRSRVRILCASIAAVFFPGHFAYADRLGDLVDAAKAEGTLTVIGLPHDWCGYGRAIEAFKKRYGLAVTELNPDASSGGQIELLKATRDSQGAQVPDMIEVGLSFGVLAKASGLIQPYKVATWGTIPAETKDPEGYWYGDYYGVLAFEINEDIVKRIPADWPDLQAADYKNAIALAGDPRASNLSILSVYAAGLSVTGGNPSKAPEAGLSFFRSLNEAGNFVPAAGNAANVANGTTPVAVRWDYLALTDRDILNGNPPVKVVVPKTGAVVGLDVQAIPTNAPHPNAARLWMEYLYSDEAQLNYLASYCHPVRFKDLVARRKIPEDLLARLPPSEAYANAVTPTLDELVAAKQAISAHWDQVISVRAK